MSDSECGANYEQKGNVKVFTLIHKMSMGRSTGFLRAVLKGKFHIRDAADCIICIPATYHLSLNLTSISVKIILNCRSCVCASRKKNEKPPPEIMWRLLFFWKKLMVFDCPNNMQEHKSFLIKDLLSDVLNGMPESMEKGEFPLF